MAITIEDHLYVRYNGNIVDDIGLSDTLNNISTEDLMNFIYCGGYNRGIRAFIPNTVNATIADLDYVPFDFMMMPSTHTFIFDKGGSSPNGAYMGIIWLYTANSFGNYPDDNASRYRVVCQWDAPNYYISLPNPSGTHSGATSWSDADNDKCYSTGNNSIGSLTYMYKESGNTHNITVGYVRPYMMYLLDSGKLIFTKMRMDINNFRFREWGGTPDQPTQIASAGSITHSFRQSGDAYDIFGTSVDTFDLGLPYSWSLGYGSQVSGNPNAWGTCIENMIFYASGGGNHYSVKSSGMFSFYLNTRHETLLFWANCGIKFYAGSVLYKPIINDGIVIGYTDDMDTESDLDNWSGTTNHSIPLTPPTPPSPSGDDYEDMSLGVSNVTLGGLTKYAILSKQELIDLIIDYNSNGATAGTNFSNHIICLYRLGFGASDLVVTSSDKIKMIQSAGDVDFESSANYSIVSRQTPFIHFGSITVPRHTGTFYDFSPYSNYELYIPGCGWIPLPDNVAGRTLNVYLVFDLPTCSAKGIVRIAGGVYGGTTIATVNGIIGASVPFTIGENGMQRAAILSGSVQTAAALGTAFLGVGIGNPYMGASGVAMATTGIANNYVAGNTNFISTKGGASDFSAFGDGATAMLKYNSPEIDPVVNNTIFGHTVGYLCNEVGKLSTFSGFTVCDNPHVTFSASAEERDEIERLLSMGVIL